MSKYALTKLVCFVLIVDLNYIFYDLFFYLINKKCF